MSHGKETPRQKMIGMMYLVLMALLALNVSKDVLDAFAILDEGLVKTLETIQSNNSNTVANIDRQYQMNAQKVGPIKERADKVTEYANEIVSFIQEKKIEIVKEAEGSETESIDGDHINVANIDAKDNKDAPERIMIGDANDRAAKEIKEKIEAFRNYLLSEVLTEKDEQIRHSIEILLNTTAGKGHGAADHGGDGLNEWEREQFGHLPLGGIMAVMSGLQINIRNAEADVLNYLTASIGKEDFKFNKLEATVIPNSNYIIRGGEYQAEVFLAASDSTAVPRIFVTENPNAYDSARNEITQNWEYSKRPGLAYDSIEVKKGSGKGIFKRTANSLGSKSWGGIIELTGPTGAKIRKPFKGEYMVAEGSVVVSPTKMNVFYLGVDNPVDVSVAGFQPSQISVDATNASIEKKGGSSYIIKPKRPGNSFVNVSVKIDGKVKQMGQQEFRVKSVPNPYPTVADKQGGSIAKSLLMAQVGMKAEMGKDFDFDLTFRITGFKVSANVGGFFRSVESTDYKFTRDQMNLIKNLDKGDRVFLEDITAVGPDGTVRNLSPINFKLN